MTARWQHTSNKSLKSTVWSVPNVGWRHFLSVSFKSHSGAPSYPNRREAAQMSLFRGSFIARGDRQADRWICKKRLCGSGDGSSGQCQRVISFRFFQTSNVSFSIHKPTVNYVNRSRWFFELFVCDTVIVFLLGQSVEWRSRMFNKINYYFYFFSTLLLFISTALWLYFQHGLLT